MTLIRAAWLSLVALALAAWLLWRLLRGRSAIEPRDPPREGSVMSRAVRIAAIVLVVVGARLERAAAQPPADGSAAASAASADFPAALRSEDIHTYAELHDARRPLARVGRLLAQADEPGWASRPELERAAELGRAEELARAAHAGPLSARLVSALDRIRGGRRHTLDDLSALLDAADRTPAYEAWLGAWILRRSGELRMSAPERAALNARVERHLRVAEALERAMVEVGPTEFVPWRSMAMAPPGYRSTRAPAGLAAAAERLYRTITLDPWAREGAMDLAVVQGSAELWRRGSRASLAPSASVRLGRLDVLAAPSGAVVLEHAALGRITVPRDGVLHARNLWTLLDGAQRARIQAWITAGRGGDEQALASLEASLPAAHELLRAAIAAEPQAPGSARLRTLLALFDE